MKRGTTNLEPWSTKEKLCLSSAVLRSGDQNWMSVSRVLRVFGEQDRPSEWYSQKQCAQQYEALLTNVGTSKRKKRSEKGVETVDTPNESIVRKLLQERVEELTRLLEEDRREFKRIKKEKEDIESGKADDRLDEFEREIEGEKEREATRGSILRQHEERNRLESGRLTPHMDSQTSTENSIEQAESKVPTSPLLTSLLQSPSHYRAASSIHNLLNPTPPHPHPLSRTSSDSPTLSRLLESPATKQFEPTVLFSNYVKKEQAEEERLANNLEEPPAVEEVSSMVEEVETEVPILTDVKTEIQSEEPSLQETDTKEYDTTADVITEIPMQDVEIEIASVDTEKTPAVSPPVKIEIEEIEAEKEEPEHSSLTTLQDSDTMEDQQSITELDSQTVNMIVAGAGVISVSHDTSSEHLEEVTSSDIQHQEDSEAAESVKEDSLDDVCEEITTTVSVNIEEGSCQTVEPDALNNFIIGSETQKDNYVVQVLCSTPEHVLEEEAKTPEVNEPQKSVNPQEEPKGDEIEVGVDMVNLDGAVAVEEEDTMVHAVEVLVSTTPTGGKETEEEDSIQDGELKEAVPTPDTEAHEESQEEDEASTPKTNSNEEIEKEDKDGDDKGQTENTADTVQTISKNVIDSKPGSPSTTEDDSEGGAKRPAKTRLISGSVCSDSKPSSPACHMLEDSKEYRSWKKSIMLVYNRLATHKFASIFLRPITNEQAPAYDTVIHRPVDLSTIKKRIETGELRTTVDFQRDLLLMFQNAIMYNHCQTHVYEMASIMQNECMQHIELMVEAMGEGVFWRRDTVSLDKLNTRGRGEAPKRKRASMEDAKSGNTKRRKDSTN